MSFALGFYYSVANGFDEDGWTVENETDNFDEIIEDLFDARNAAAAGEEHWQGCQLMIWTLRDGSASWEHLDDGSRVE